MAFIGGFSFGLISHEMAHQWFGDKVTCGSWHDIFLMKALPPPGGFMP
jgi:aminopeptidase N